MTMVEMESVFIPVPAPPAVAYRYGLFSVATPIPDAETDWEGFGMTWVSSACAQPRITYDACIVDAVDPLEDDGPICAQPQFDTFTVYARGIGSIRNRAEDEASIRARLVEVEQFGVESQLWADMAAATTEVATSDGLLHGLAVVEQLLVEAYPALGVIHMNRFAAVMLGDHLSLEGGRLVTRLGTPVVAGGGYGAVAGAAPATATIYGTGPLVLRRGQAVADTITPDREANSATAFAHRTYAVGWDCTAVGVTVTL